MSRPSDHLAFQFDELNRINSAISTLQRIGIGPLDDAMQALRRAQGQALGKLGLAQPRTSTLLRTLIGLSPGTLRLFLDAERGWLIEGLESPNARPVFRYVPDEVAERILLNQVDHEFFTALLEEAPDYIA